MKQRDVVRLFSLLVILSLGILLPHTAVRAQTPDPEECAESITVDYFKIDFIEDVSNGDDTSTYYYAVTSHPDGYADSTDQYPPALSHWGIELCEWFLDDNFAPTSDGNPATTEYTTPGDYTTTTKDPNNYTVFGRSGIQYSVGTGGSSPNVWIKWEESSVQLGNNGATDTDIFSVTVSDFFVYNNTRVTVQTGPIWTQVKAGSPNRGNSGGVDTDVYGLCGPWVDSCSDPTSVCFVGLEARSPSLLGWFLGLLGLE
jgi:hypothetical protein